MAAIHSHASSQPDATHESRNLHAVIILRASRDTHLADAARKKGSASKETAASLQTATRAALRATNQRARTRRRLAALRLLRGERHIHHAHLHAAPDTPRRVLVNHHQLLRLALGACRSHPAHTHTGQQGGAAEAQLGRGEGAWRPRDAEAGPGRTSASSSRQGPRLASRPCSWPLAGRSQQRHSPVPAASATSHPGHRVPRARARRCLASLFAIVAQLTMLAACMHGHLLPTYRHHQPAARGQLLHQRLGHRGGRGAHMDDVVRRTCQVALMAVSLRSSARVERDC